MKMPSFRIAVTLPLLLQAALAFQPLVFSGTRVSGSNSRLLATVVRNPEAEDAAKAAYALPPIPPNGKRLFLIRHGEVVNPGGSRKVFYGDMNVPLTLLGQKEACVAADYLSRSKLTAVYTSPLSRAFYGAQQVGARQQQQETLLTPIRLQGLSELKPALIISARKRLLRLCMILKRRLQFLQNGDSSRDLTALAGHRLQPWLRCAGRSYIYAVKCYPCRVNRHIKPAFQGP